MIPRTPHAHYPREHDHAARPRARQQPLVSPDVRHHPNAITRKFSDITGYVEWIRVVDELAN
jgi:hypothetical protein